MTKGKGKGSKSKKADTKRSTRKRTRDDREDSSEGSGDDPFRSHTDLERENSTMKHLERREKQIREKDEEIRRLMALLESQGQVSYPPGRRLNLTNLSVLAISSHPTGIAAGTGTQITFPRPIPQVTLPRPIPNRPRGFTMA